MWVQVLLITLMMFNYLIKKAMKKILTTTGSVLMLLLFVTACQEDDTKFGNISAPSNLELTYEIVGQDAENPDGDGSGKVNLKATAENAISYKYFFSDQTSANAPTGMHTKQFTRNGVNTYTVTVVANGKGGVSTSTSVNVTVLSNFSDEEAVELLTGGNTKTWYWAAAKPGHLGVGPNNDNPAENASPIWYSAAPFEKAGSPNSSCLYDNVLTFTKEGENLKYMLDNGGQTFFNAAYVSVGGGSQTEDFCLPYDTSGEKTVLLGPTNSLVDPAVMRGTTMTFSDGGFMGYYIGTSTYDIVSLTNTEMVVRAVMGNDPGLAWYHIFSTQPPNGGTEEPEYTNLIWSDEFNIDGAPDPANWTMELGNEGGWGNEELQYYRAENAIVEGGFLKITAKAENFSGFNYTSARMKTQDKFDFTYGMVEIRAKLPTGGGTWPALWMLGANFPSVGWPASGEIDIMEHVGNSQDVIHGTLHFPGNSGGNGVGGSTTVSGVSSEFHIYAMKWTPERIRFYVDGVEFFTFVNTPATPFHNDFFLIFNVAMGGTFGGNVEDGFTQSTMEVDYVKVYQ